MIDITTIGVIIVASASLITIPIQMLRHLRTDFKDKLECGEKKFDMIIEKLEKCADNMSKCHADYSAVNAKLEMLINSKK